MERRDEQLLAAWCIGVTISWFGIAPWVLWRTPLKWWSFAPGIVGTGLFVTGVILLSGDLLHRQATD